MGKVDLSSKQFFSDSVKFADLVNGILFGGREVVRSDDLTDGPTEYVISDINKELSADIVKIWKKNSITFAVLALEEQSYVDYGMVIRNFILDGIIYHNEIRKIKSLKSGDTKETVSRNEFLSGISRDTKLSPVITIVLNLSEDKWDGARSLHEMLDMDDRIKPFVNDYKLNLYDYHDYDNYESFRTDLRIVFRALNAGKDRMKLREIFSETGELEGNTMRLLGNLLSVNNVEQYIEKKDGREKGRMCKALEDIKEEGREEGREEGYAEAMSQIEAERGRMCKALEDIKEEGREEGKEEVRREIIELLSRINNGEITLDEAQMLYKADTTTAD